MPPSPPPKSSDATAQAIAGCLRALGHPVAATALIDSARMAKAEGSTRPWIDALSRYGFAAHIEPDVDPGRLAAELFPCVAMEPAPARMLTAPPASGQGRAAVMFMRPRLDRDVGTQPTSWAALSAGLKPMIARASVAGMLANVLALAAPVFSAQVYDRVLPHGLTDSLAAMAVIFLAAALFEQVFRRLRALFVEDALHESNVRLAMDMHRRILDTRFDGAPAPAGHLMRLLQDYDTMRDGFGAAAVSLFADLPFMVLFFVGLLLCDPLIAVAVLALNGAIVVGSLITIRRQRLLHGELSKAATRRAQAAQEAFVDPEAARRVGAATYLQGRFRQGAVLYAAAARTIRSLAALRGNLALLAQNLSVLVAVGLGGWYAVAGGMSAGLILAASMLATRFTGASLQVVAVIPQGLAALASLEAMRKVSERPTVRGDGAGLIHRPVCAGILTLEGVSARYPGTAQPALADVSLSVPAGGRLAVVGPAGSGKTTLEKVLTGVLRPESGRVLLDGVDLVRIDPADLSRHVAVCPQNPPLYSGTLRTNLSFDGSASDEAMIAMLAALGANAVMPLGTGLDFEIAEGGRNLSGGQRQLVALARTLLAPSALLILDEPTTGLDAGTEKRAVAAIDTVVGNRTLVVISHRPTVVGLAPQAAVIERGRLTRLGARDEVLRAKAPT
ncbi:MAG: ATP-binding cassette domain-containing protein [Magnetospirillum sp.]|nr:ATP-binding cassette domain-containing protein [Magnetospirillum sp.]